VRRCGGAAVRRCGGAAVRWCPNSGALIEVSVSRQKCRFRWDFDQRGGGGERMVGQRRRRTGTGAL